MPVFKSQILLGVGDAGWSENYWIQAASHAAAMTALQSVCTARMALSMADVLVRVLRVSDAAIKGDSWLQPAATPAGTSAVVSVTFDPAVALQVNGYSADHAAWTHWFVRGIPSSQVKLGEPFQLIAVPDAGFTAALTAYKAALAANVFLYTKKPNPPGTKNAVPVATTGHNTLMVVRKAGRPFSLRRGRRVIV